MRKLFLYMVLSFFGVIAGCTVFSVNPIANSENTIVDANLVGGWKNKDAEVEVAFNEKSKGYDITVIVDGNKPGPFDGKLVQIDDKRFLQLYPKDFDDTLKGTDAEKINVIYWSYLQPLYGFLYVEDVNDSTAMVYSLDQKKMNMYLKNKNIKYYMIDEYRLLICDDGDKTGRLLAESIDSNNIESGLWEQMLFERKQ